MITIIAGTNRKTSNSKKIAAAYKIFLGEKNIESQILSLDELEVFERNDGFVNMENLFLKKADKLIFILPEYNGSFPGIVKLMVDNTDVANVWPGKKVLLTGVSTGRAGNLRGLEHFTGVMLYLKANVHHNRLPISVVHTLLNSNEALTDIITIQAIKNQLSEFLSF
jgi:chromate reductase, NAD(P)H dehydrogenase (quinone)